jgi:mRNA interferase MazF
MEYQDRFNGERYLDMTAYLAMKHIEETERRQRKLREDWDFHRGDIYMADLGSGREGINGSHVQGGIRPVVLLQNNVGNYFSPTLIIVPLTSRLWKKPSQPTHYLVRQTGRLTSDSIALGEQITTIDKRQCIKYLGRLSRQETDAIKDVAICAIGGDVDIPECQEAP